MKDEPAEKPSLGLPDVNSRVAYSSPKIHVVLHRRFVRF